MSMKPLKPQLKGRKREKPAKCPHAEERYPLSADMFQLMYQIYFENLQYHLDINLPKLNNVSGLLTPYFVKTRLSLSQTLTF